VSECINRNLTARVIEWQFGRKVPVLCELRLRTKTRDNLAADIGIVEKAKAMGVRVSKAWFTGKFGIVEADIDETALGELTKPETDAANAYNPLQARNPKGSQGGGRWTSMGSASKGHAAVRGAMRPATDDDRKKFGVAPAFTDVMVTDDPAADLLATAKNANGKKVYYYSQSYAKSQAGAKFGRIAALHRAMPQLQARIDEDILAGGPDREQALALRMISITGLRNGGEDGGGKVETFGASNLRPDQCRVEGNKVHLDFVGKKGVRQRHSFEDAALARHIAARQKEGADRVFAGNADKTLAYLKKISGDKFKVHDFRTWHGTMLADATAAKIAGKGEAPKSEKEFKAFQKRVARVVGRQLGNDPNMALKAYIHPEVFTPYHPSGDGPVRKKAA
jgi:DNA topoisomerase I